jgi:chemotaxis protein methyltransferase CheR
MSAHALRGAEDDLDLEIDLLIEAIYRKYSYDFRHYARASLRRRITQALTHFGVRTVSQLQDVIMRDAAAFSRLLSRLTVPVSDLFRDPPFFAALREHVLPVLATYPSLKVWVAGCSTGEESYSMAILLQEAGLLERTIIYATDINLEALSAAEKGIYGLERMAGFTRNYQRAGGRRSLADYYTAAFDQAVFDRRLRKAITFSDHCLATDHVFAELHLISCRNVLIYFDHELQHRAVGLFHDSLVPRGYLGLGSHERLAPDAARRFETIHARERIYRKVA